MSAREFTNPGAPGSCAAPAGGPTWWGRGCASICLTGLVFGAALLLARPLAAEDLSVPSGRAVSFHDVITDAPGGPLTYRFRFLAPQLAQEKDDFEAIAADLQSLCDGFALPRVSEIGPQPGRIVISLMSEPVEFGVMTPEVTQLFESYSLEDGACIWEAF